MLWDEPSLLAQALVEAKTLPADPEDVINGILFQLYGNFFSPREDQAVLHILEHFISVNVMESDSPEAWLRENSFFSRLFSTYAKCALFLMG